MNPNVMVVKLFAAYVINEIFSCLNCMESIKWNESENPIVSDNRQNCEYDKYNKKMDVVKPPIAMKSYINNFGKGGRFSLYMKIFFDIPCIKNIKFVILVFIK